MWIISKGCKWNSFAVKKSNNIDLLDAGCVNKTVQHYSHFPVAHIILQHICSLQTELQQQIETFYMMFVCTFYFID